MEKKRIYLSLHGGQRFESITWYRGTPINDIIDSIRARFKLSAWQQIGVYDTEDSYVVLSDNVPDNARFFIRVDSGNTPPTIEENQANVYYQNIVEPTYQHFPSYASNNASPHIKTNQTLRTQQPAMTGNNQQMNLNGSMYKGHPNQMAMIRQGGVNQSFDNSPARVLVSAQAESAPALQYQNQQPQHNKREVPQSMAMIREIDPNMSGMMASNDLLVDGIGQVASRQMQNVQGYPQHHGVEVASQQRRVQGGAPASSSFDQHPQVAMDQRVPHNMNQSLNLSQDRRLDNSRQHSMEQPPVQLRNQARSNSNNALQPQLVPGQPQEAQIASYAPMQIRPNGQVINEQMMPGQTYLVPQDLSGQAQNYHDAFESPQKVRVPPHDPNNQLSQPMQVHGQSMMYMQPPAQNDMNLRHLSSGQNGGHRYHDSSIGTDVQAMSLRGAVATDVGNQRMGVIGNRGQQRVLSNITEMTSGMAMSNNLSYSNANYLQQQRNQQPKDWQEVFVGRGGGILSPEAAIAAGFSPSRYSAIMQATQEVTSPMSMSIGPGARLNNNVPLETGNAAQYLQVEHSMISHRPSAAPHSAHPGNASDFSHRINAPHQSMQRQAVQERSHSPMSNNAEIGPSARMGASSRIGAASNEYNLQTSRTVNEPVSKQFYDGQPVHRLAQFAYLQHLAGSVPNTVDQRAQPGNPESQFVMRLNPINEPHNRVDAIPQGHLMQPQIENPAPEIHRVVPQNQIQSHQMMNAPDSSAAHQSRQNHQRLPSADTMQALASMPLPQNHPLESQHQPQMPNNQIVQRQDGSQPLNNSRSGSEVKQNQQPGVQPVVYETSNVPIDPLRDQSYMSNGLGNSYLTQDGQVQHLQMSQDVRSRIHGQQPEMGQPQLQNQIAQRSLSTSVDQSRGQVAQITDPNLSRLNATADPNYQREVNRSNSTVNPDESQYYHRRTQFESNLFPHSQSLIEPHNQSVSMIDDSGVQRTGQSTIPTNQANRGHSHQPQSHGHQMLNEPQKGYVAMQMGHNAMANGNLQNMHMPQNTPNMQQRLTSTYPSPNQHRQTTVAVDMSPMTVYHPVFVPKYNQQRVGSVLDAQSVHKLNNFHEMMVWNQRFVGGLGGSNFYQRGGPQMTDGDNMYNQNPNQRNGAMLYYEAMNPQMYNAEHPSIHDFGVVQDQHHQRSFQMRDDNRMHHEPSAYYHPPQSQRDDVNSHYYPDQQYIHQSQVSQRQPYHHVHNQNMHDVSPSSGLTMTAHRQNNRPQVAMATQDMLGATAMSISQFQDLLSVDGGGLNNSQVMHQSQTWALNQSLQVPGQVNQHHQSAIMNNELHPQLNASAASGQHSRNHSESRNRRPTSRAGSNQSQRLLQYNSVVQSTSQRSLSSYHCPVVKPTDKRQVVQLRNQFLEIARKEREDSKERDKNFMPEVRRVQNTALIGGSNSAADVKSVENIADKGVDGQSRRSSLMQRNSLFNQSPANSHQNSMDGRSNSQHYHSNPVPQNHGNTGRISQEASQREQLHQPVLSGSARQPQHMQPNVQYQHSQNNNRSLPPLGSSSQAVAEGASHQRRQSAANPTTSQHHGNQSLQSHQKYLTSAQGPSSEKGRSNQNTNYNVPIRRTTTSRTNGTTKPDRRRDIGRDLNDDSVECPMNENGFYMPTTRSQHISSLQNPNLSENNAPITMSQNDANSAGLTQNRYSLHAQSYQAPSQAQNAIFSQAQVVGRSRANSFATPSAVQAQNNAQMAKNVQAIAQETILEQKQVASMGRSDSRNEATGPIETFMRQTSIPRSQMANTNAAYSSLLRNNRRQASMNDAENKLQQSPSASNATGRSFISNISMGGRSLLAMQMSNNGLMFEDSSSRLQMRVTSRREGKSQKAPRRVKSTLGTRISMPDDKATKAKSKKRLSKRKTLQVLPSSKAQRKWHSDALLKANEAEGQESNRFGNNVLQDALDKEQPRHSRQQLFKRPAGYRTMNERELRLYQCNLFRLSEDGNDKERDDEDDNSPPNAFQHAKNNNIKNQTQLAARNTSQNQNQVVASTNAGPQGQTALAAAMQNMLKIDNSVDESMKGAAHIGEGDQEKSMQRHNLPTTLKAIESHSEFNGISSISQLRPENQSQFLDSRDADNLL